MRPDDGGEGSRHEAPMKRLSDEAQKTYLRTLVGLCYLRIEGTASEDRVAHELGFVDGAGIPSARVMHERLQEWGLPDWVVNPGDAGERTETQNQYKVPDTETTKERKARTTGDVKELPPAGRAVRLFRQDLERLNYYLDEQPALKEQLQAERFVSSFWVGEDWDYYPKSEFSEDQWKELCERYGEDPSAEGLGIPIDPIKPQGASPTPWEGLVPLIAVHAIMYKTVDALIDALHPDPSSVDRVELYKEKGYVNTLRTYAERLAKTVRGVEVRKGHKLGKVSDLEHWVTLFLIEPLAEEGYTDEQIYARIKQEHSSLGELYTVDDVARLRKLRLPPPDRTSPENLT